ncbi:MAG: DEAD/DEAH box helicase [Isosphaeraceae bacterium]
MTVTVEALNALRDHWAVSAIDAAERERLDRFARMRYVHAHVGKQLHLSQSSQNGDLEKLRRLAMAYELAAVEGIDAILGRMTDARGEELERLAQAGAYKAYELLRSLDIPQDDHDRIYHVLHLSALAYCGDRWSDLRRWLKEHRDHVVAPSVAQVEWDKRVTYRLFDCWVRLFRKNRWDDLDRIREIIAGLREDQKRFEKPCLEPEGDSEVRIKALRLVALYHWARATELLAVYMLQGEPTNISTELDQHFERSKEAANSSHDVAFEVLVRWLHVAARLMVSNSIWWVSETVNSRATQFVRYVTKSRSLFELLPPQRDALREQGLLDPTSRAVIVDLPTSGGKTVLAQFRILQALNQFDADKGWVAYVAPTRALTSQITRRLREDFEGIRINVEQLTGAVEIDTFEEALLTAEEPAESFHVLVATPEKLNLVIRNGQVRRPLALIVMDEAHNIEDRERGLRIELLLATIKRECRRASFLLMMPYVPNADELARWLDPEAGRSVSLATSAWQPNERIVGIYQIQANESDRKNWRVTYETLTTTPQTIHLEGTHQVGPVRPLDRSFTDAKSLTKVTAAVSKVFSDRGTSVGVARTIDDCWTMARTVAAELEPIVPLRDEIKLVQRFLATEVSPQFELIEMLSKGVGIHHAGLSDEARALIEWLTEESFLKVLCATTTISQGINFPVSSVFLASHIQDYGREMPIRAFWNLAGRAGRIHQDSIGVVGIASNPDQASVNRVTSYVIKATENLVSRLVTMLDEVERQGGLNNLSLIINNEEWTDFRSYVAHLWNEKKNLDEVLKETEQILRNTFGYTKLRSDASEVQQAKARALLDATRDYARHIAENPGNAALADSTGFSPEGVASAFSGLRELPRRLTAKDWEPTTLFGDQAHSVLPGLIGVMLNVPQIRKSITELSGESLNRERVAKIAQAWVAGQTIEQIAKRFFAETGTDARAQTEAITNACKAIYRNLVNVGTWGLSALSKLGKPAGLDFAKLPPEVQRRVNAIPAMLYHGVTTEEAVLMRMNSVPRSIAERLGEHFEREVRREEKNVRVARAFLRSLEDDAWQAATPEGSALSGSDYKHVWKRLSGEAE